MIYLVNKNFSILFKEVKIWIHSDTALGKLSIG